jgi:putative Mg2+ transporter-C (MgtC) family protein
VLSDTHVRVDPSRVAAPIVSGIGFIGGGIIFVRRDAVRGLTTAAGVWMTAAVGMACGGDLPIVALATTVIYFVVAYGYPHLVKLLPRSRYAPSELSLVYLDGHGTLREALERCALRGFTISDLSIKRDGHPSRNRGEPEITVGIQLRGQRSIAELAAELYEIEGILDVRAGSLSELMSD